MALVFNGTWLFAPLGSLWMHVEMLAMAVSQETIIV